MTDPIVYLGKDMKSFEIGTEEQAKEKGWVSMTDARSQFDDEETFIKKVSNITMLNKEEREHLIKNPK